MGWIPHVAPKPEQPIQAVWQQAHNSKIEGTRVGCSSAGSTEQHYHVVSEFPAIRTLGRMASDEPGLGQKYALDARRHIATLRAKEPNVRIEIRWYPSHQGIEGNEVADKWAKLVADGADAHRMEWLSTRNPDGTVIQRHFPLP